MFIHRFRCKPDSQFLEGLDIDFRQHDRGMDLTVFQLGKLLQGDLRIFVGCGAHGEGNEDLVRVEARVFAAEIIDLQLLDWLNSSR